MQEQKSKVGKQAQSLVKIAAGGIALDHTQVEAKGDLYMGNVLRNEQHQHIHQASDTPESLEKKINSLAEQLEKPEIVQNEVYCRSLLAELKTFSQKPIFSQLSKHIQRCVKTLLIEVDVNKIQTHAQAIVLAIFSKYHLIPYEKLEVGIQLGRGSFGKVYLGRYNHQAVAIKETFGELTPNTRKSLIEEIRIMLQLNSDFVVRLHGISVDHSPILVMECMNQGNLTNLIGNDEIHLPWLTRYQLAKDIACGLDVLHINKIIHRDLKSMNVLLCHKDRRYWAKISDFGLSQVKSSSRVSSAGQQAAKSIGTTAWKAPELFGLKPQYSSASDMYAYSMVLWEMSTRTLPFSGVTDSSIEICIGRGERAEIPESCPIGMKNLIERLWHQKPNNRLTAKQAISEMESLLTIEAEKEEKDDHVKINILQAIKIREEDMLHKQKILEIAAEEQAKKISEQGEKLKVTQEELEHVKKIEQSQRAKDGQLKTNAPVAITPEHADDAETNVEIPKKHSLATAVMKVGLLKQPDTVTPLQWILALKKNHKGFDEVVPTLERCLRDPDSRVKDEASAVLRKWAGNGNEAAVSVIAKELLKESEKTMRLKYLLVLKKSYKGSTHAVTAVEEACLRDNDPQVKAESLAVLGKWAGDGNKDAVLVLANLLGELDTASRLQCLVALKKNYEGSARAVPAVEACLRDEDPQVKAEALAVLGKWAGDGNKDAALVLANLLGELDTASRLQCLVALKKNYEGSARAVPAVEACLRDEDPQVKAEALAVLGKWAGDGNKDAVLVLAKLLEELDTASRLQCLVALKKNYEGSARAVPAVEACLRDEDPQVKAEAGAVLRKWAGDGNKAAISVAVAMLKNRDTNLRLQGLFVLKGRSRRASSAIPALEACLQEVDVDPKVRDEAETILQNWENSSRVGTGCVLL